MAAATKKTIVEVETIVPTGSIKPEDVHIPAIYVSNVVHVPNPERFTEV